MTHEPILLPKVRLESLVDGVLAIAMTLLILEVKLPELADRRSAVEMFQRLGHALPTLLAYFFSFGMLALFWVWHHRLAAKVARLDKVLIAISLGFLSLVSFFPFAAALLGRYPLNAGSLAVYMPVVGGILLCQVAFFGHARRAGLVEMGVTAEESLRVHKRNLKGALIFTLWATPSLLRLGWIWAVVPLLLSVTLVVAMRRAR
jgi:uncharacterized membrane protein